MLIEKGDKFLISYCSQIKEIKIFLKKNLNNPNIQKKTLDELYCLYIYLYYLCGSEYFSLPLLIQKPDPPDFILEQQVVSYKTSIEVVSSSTQCSKHAFIIMEREYPEGSLLESPYYVQSSKADLKEGIREPNEPLKSPGFGDYGKESAWMTCIHQTLKKKTSKINKYKDHHSQYQINELIIYDDTNYYPEVDYVVAKLRQNYQPSVNINFNRVHIIMNVMHLFIVDVFGQYSRFDITPDII